MGVGRFTPLRFTANIKSILHACSWSYFINFDSFSDILAWHSNSVTVYRYGILHIWSSSFFRSRRNRNRYIRIGYRFPV